MLQAAELKMEWTAAVKYLSRLVNCSWVEGEHGSKMEAGLWVPYDIKIMFLSLRCHISLQLRPVCISVDVTPWMSETEYKGTQLGEQTHRSAL